MDDPASPYFKAAVQGLLENESLTADLDDEAARALLDWGIANLRRILEANPGLLPEQLEEATYASQRANRKLLRQVNRWTASRSEKTPEGNAEMMGRVLALAAELQPGAQAVAPERQESFLAFSEVLTAPVFIRLLRDFIENH